MSGPRKTPAGPWASTAGRSISPRKRRWETLRESIAGLNADESVDAILVQLPLPKHLRTNEVIGWIRPDKDVDGIHPESLGLLLQNQPGLRPCTPMGVLELIKATGVPIEGRDVVIIGRSLIVGKPLAALITNANGTVTICHSKTRDLAGTAARADILIAAMGKAAFVTREFVKPGAVVIDVGTSAVSDPADDPDPLRRRPAPGQGPGRQGLHAGRRRGPPGHRHGRLADPRSQGRRAVDHRHADEKHPGGIQIAPGGKTRG